MNYQQHYAPLRQRKRVENALMNCRIHYIVFKFGWKSTTIEALEHRPSILQAINTLHFVHKRSLCWRCISDTGLKQLPDKKIMFPSFTFQHDEICYKPDNITCSFILIHNQDIGPLTFIAHEMSKPHVNHTIPCDAFRIIQNGGPKFCYQCKVKHKCFWQFSRGEQ